MFTCFKILVEYAVVELHHRGIRVVCLTMDGRASNNSTICARSLGVSSKQLLLQTSHKPWQSVCHDGCLAHAEAGSQYVAGTCRLLPICSGLLYSAFYSLINRICLIVENMVLYIWNMLPVKIFWFFRHIQPNWKHHWHNQMELHCSNERCPKENWSTCSQQSHR